MAEDNKLAKEVNVVWDGQERRSHEPIYSKLDTVENRVLRLEWTQNAHSEAIDRLERTTHCIENDLDRIQSTLQQIKYFVMGASAWYVADSIGATTILKILIGM